MEKIKHIKHYSKRRLSRSLGGDIGIGIVLALFGLFFVWPLIYSINNAFKPLNELFLFPPKLWVMHPTLSNWRDMFVLLSASWVPFSRYLANSLFITVVGTAGLIVFASLGAFVVSKFAFPGSRAIMKLVTLAMMFPVAVTSIPSYIIMTRLGWVDSYWAVIIPAFCMPMGFFLLKQYIDTIPDTLIEASYIDGANEGRIFLNIVLPLIRPAWLTVIIFSVQALWNAPQSTFIFSEQLKTLPYALSQIVSGGVARTGAGAAVALFMMIIPIAVFIFSQSNVMKTMATSGIKE
jgi:ABC-type glycerol-3-phosphate transport system permease component